MSINVLKLDNQKFWIFYPATVLIICGIIVHDVNCVPVNVALNKPIKAYYTCGAFERESYTTLTDAYSAVSNRPKRSCSYAPANATGVKATFPAEAMVDGVSTTWWQSTSRFRSYEYGTVLFNERSMELEAMINIDLYLLHLISLLQEFLASKITIQNGDALTPQRMAIEKSTDGNTYTPWIYAVSLPDWCGTIFPSAYKTVPSSVTDTICVDYVADDKPPGDAITVDLSEVPIALKEWQRIRYLNVKFYDMMFVYPFNSLANSYNHYAVTELSVFAECPCNGQQSGCEISNTTGMYECICGGNTKGMFCESCLPLFNQYQFKYGEPCVACNCFGHASSCFYQASVEAGNFSLDSEGKRRGGGVCVDCQNFTAGVNCEKCVALYYRPSGRIQTAGDACVPCLCNASGSDLNPATGLVDCVMSDDVAAEGKKPGDCYCKANVMGSKCDTCKQGFYNLQSSNLQGCSFVHNGTFVASVNNYFMSEH
ncbi:laminin subunit alpha-2-like [Physella acuta]|uniref:laminin subunit alpha-2-like n=1 Tax=Physella acuta TaxID=109671 RepID=UPI0027DDBA47|nr:laminin subunit alpha-2-like [Physella acuta]